MQQVAKLFYFSPKFHHDLVGVIITVLGAGRQGHEMMPARPRARRHSRPKATHDAACKIESEVLIRRYYFAISYNLSLKSARTSGSAPPPLEFSHELTAHEPRCVSNTNGRHRMHGRPCGHAIRFRASRHARWMKREPSPLAPLSR